MVELILMLVIYVAAMVAVAYYSRRRSKSLNEFFLAGSGVGGWMSAFAYGTSYFSAVIFIGYAGKFGMNFGASAIWIGIGNAIIGSLFAWLILAKRTRNATRVMDVKTMPQYFEKRYDSKWIKLVTSVIVVLFLLPYSASVYQGLGELFSLIFGVGLENKETVFVVCVLVMAALTACYLFLGGYFATALTDFIQGIIMLIGVVLMAVFLFNNSAVGGLSNALSTLAEEGKGIIPSNNDIAFNLLIIILLTSLGSWGLPQMVHKFYAVKNEKSIKQATVISTVFAFIIGSLAYICGSLTIIYLAGQTVGGDAMVPTMLTMSGVLPAIVLAIISVLMLSASMSTLSALALEGSGAMILDVYKGYIKKNTKEKKQNTLVRIFSIVFIILSVLIAIFKPAGIVELMGLSWGTLAGCFIGPYVWGLYMKKANKFGCWCSVVQCLVITLILTLVLGLAKSPLIGVICMGASLVMTPLVSLATQKFVKSKPETATENAKMETEINTDESVTSENVSQIQTENN